MKKQLDSLRIERFRQIRELSIPELGHVNLIVGGNNSGKSTLLDALRFYAANAAPRLVRQILMDRGEAVEVHVSSRRSSLLLQRALSTLFYGRQYPEQDGEAIYVGNVDATQYVQLEHVFQATEVLEMTDGSGSRSIQRLSKVVPKAGFEKSGQTADAVSVKSSQSGYDSVNSVADFFDLDDMIIDAALAASSANMRCVHVSPEILSLQRRGLVDMWDDIALTDDKQIALGALRIIDGRVLDLGAKHEGLKSGSGYQGTGLPGFAVRLEGAKGPVPLQSMGDGMGRVLHLILAALFAQDGLLLVDEFENGLHHSVQTKVWEILFSLAQTRSVQVFATTHSNDCVRAFCEVALANKEVDGKLLKMERMPEDGQTVASALSEQSLSNLLDAGIEVRG